MTRPSNQDGVGRRSQRSVFPLRSASSGANSTVPRLQCPAERPCAADGSKVITDDMEIVSALHATLAEKIGRQRFELWFGSSIRIELDENTLTIAGPSQFFLDWLRSNFREQIEAACLETLGTRPELQFRVDAALRDQQQTCDPPHQSPQLGKTGGSIPQRPPAAGAFRMAAVRINRRRRWRPRRRWKPCRRLRRKYLLRSRLTDRATEGPDGAASPRWTRSSKAKRTGWPRLRPRWSSVSRARSRRLLIYGPTSVGKTHLLEGIWTASRRHHRQLTAVYLSAEQFTSHFLEALRGSGLPSFRRKYRGVGLLMIDDLQFLVGKRATQVELLHTIDTLLREGRQLVFAADRSPAELAELGPELTTRLQSGMVCRIEPPDHATRSGIVAQMARRMELHVPPDVQQFVAARLTSHARELSGALCRLQATSEALRPADHAGHGRRGLGRDDPPQRPRGAAARHRKGRLRRLRPRAGRACNRTTRRSGSAIRGCWPCGWPASTRGPR